MIPAPVARTVCNPHSYPPNRWREVAHNKRLHPRIHASTHPRIHASMSTARPPYDPVPYKACPTCTWPSRDVNHVFRIVGIRSALQASIAANCEGCVRKVAPKTHCKWDKSPLYEVTSRHRWGSPLIRVVVEAMGKRSIEFDEAYSHRTEGLITDAIHYASVETFSMMFEHIKFDIEMLDNCGLTLLCRAVQYRRADHIRFIVRECKADVNRVLYRGTALMHLIDWVTYVPCSDSFRSSINGDESDTFRALLEVGANPFVRNKSENEYWKYAGKNSIEVATELNLRWFFFRLRRFRPELFDFYQMLNIFTDPYDDSPDPLRNERDVCKFKPLVADHKRDESRA